MRQSSTISSRGARRLLEAVPPAGAGEERLAAVLTALAPEDASGAVVPEAVLAAFADHAHAHAGADAAYDAPLARARRRSGTRLPHAGRSAAVKAAVAVLAVSSGTAAAAAADILPAPAQRAAHSLFGSWGVPAPHTAHGGNDGSPPSAPGSAVPGTSATAAANAHGGAGGATGSPTDAQCSNTHTHPANGRCPVSTSASAQAGNASTARPTKTVGHAHTPTPHVGGGAAH